MACGLQIHVKPISSKLSDKVSASLTFLGDLEALHSSSTFHMWSKPRKYIFVRVDFLQPLAPDHPRMAGCFQLARSSARPSVQNVKVKCRFPAYVMLNALTSQIAMEHPMLVKSPRQESCLVMQRGADWALPSLAISCSGHVNATIMPSREITILGDFLVQVSPTPAVSLPG